MIFCNKYKKETKEEAKIFMNIEITQMSYIKFLRVIADIHI